MWFISDTRWGQEDNLNSTINRPFSSINEHDMALVERWNNRVTEDSMVYHCGGVADGNNPATLLPIANCKGIKLLVPGESDPVTTEFHPQDFVDKSMIEYKKYFSYILNESKYSIGGTNVVFDDPKGGRATFSYNIYLSHYPPIGVIDRGSSEYNHLRANPADYPEIKVFVHGHTAYAGQKSHYLGNGQVAVYVGVPAWDYAPVHITEIYNEVADCLAACGLDSDANPV